MQLGLGLVARAGHAHELALGVLRLDLARALVGLADGGSSSARRRVGQRHAAVARRSARRAGAAARSAGRRARAARQPSRPRPRHAAVVDPERAHRTARRRGSGRRSATRRPGQPAAKLMSVCDG